MKKVVFVCVENSNRSQMAEAFARMHGNGKVEPYSAGSRPSGRVNPKAIEAMRELGVRPDDSYVKGVGRLQWERSRSGHHDGLWRRVSSGSRQTTAGLADS